MEAAALASPLDLWAGSYLPPASLPRKFLEKPRLTSGSIWEQKEMES